MSDPLDDRLRQAMHGAARGVNPARPLGETRTDLLAGVARRRRRRRQRAAAALGTLTMAALAGMGLAVTLGHQGPTTTQLAVGSASRPANPGPGSARTPTGSLKSASTGASTTVHRGLPPTNSPAGDSAASSSLSAHGSSPGTGTAMPSAPSATTAPSAPSVVGSSPPVTGYGVTMPPVTAQVGPPPSTTTTTITGVSGTPTVVTQADAGATVALRVGQTLAVNLSGSTGFPWTEPTSANPAVVVLVSGAADPTTGDAYGGFQAVGVGQTTISAAENPSCLNDHPMCALPSRVWTVNVDVTG
jgi:hypothetical protein